jgi:hypothetical protein
LSLVHVEVEEVRQRSLRAGARKRTVGDLGAQDATNLHPQQSRREQRSLGVEEQAVERAPRLGVEHDVEARRRVEVRARCMKMPVSGLAALSAS